MKCSLPKKSTAMLYFDCYMDENVADTACAARFCAANKLTAAKFPAPTTLLWVTPPPMLLNARLARTPAQNHTPHFSPRSSTGRPANVRPYAQVQTKGKAKS